MKIEITYYVDNEEWSNQDYEDKGDRVAVFTEAEIVEFLRDKIQLPDENEYITDIQRIDILWK